MKPDFIHFGNKEWKGVFLKSHARNNGGLLHGRAIFLWDSRRMTEQLRDADFLWKGKRGFCS